MIMYSNYCYQKSNNSLKLLHYLEKKMITLSIIYSKSLLCYPASYYII